MHSRFMRKVVVRLAIFGAGLAVMVTPAGATPLVLDWQVIGVGAGNTSCVTVSSFCGNTTFGPGQAIGKHIGSSTYSVVVAAGTAGGGDGQPNGNCALAAGSGSVTAANGDAINFNTTGLLCSEGGFAMTPNQYTGTYRITGGSGRFSSAVGGGSLSATLFGAVSFIKIDGTINF